jgi:dTMP kinase
MGSREGIFLSLEGGEGSGKTTQLRRIAEYLRSRGREVLETREPGGTEVGERIREILLARASVLHPRAELALYLASRAQLVESVIRPALSRGVDVVCDRYMDSSTAYQGGGRELGFELVERLNEWAIAGIRPHLTLYFDVAPQTGLERREAGSGGKDSLDRMEAEPLEFHEKVRSAFQHIADRVPHRFRIVRVEGGEEEVWEQARRILEETLQIKRKHE